MNILIPLKRGFESLFLFVAVVCAVHLSAVSLKAQSVVIPATPECGQFALRNLANYQIPARAVRIAIGDFNDDSIPDVVSALQDSNSVSISLGNDLTGFSAAREFVAGVTPNDLAVADFNRDGDLDVAVTTTADALVSILYGDGAGNLSLPVPYSVPSQPTLVETADLNADGWADLIVGNAQPQGLSIFLGGREGFRAAAPASIALNGVPRSFRAADFNHDGNPDIFLVAENSANSTFQLRLFHGNGLGAFTDAFSLNVASSYAIDASDFNSDGFADVVTAPYQDGKIRVYINNQTGGFAAPLEISPGNTSFTVINAIDVNADGKTDIVNGGSVLVNDGNALFAVQTGANLAGDEFADFNGDGNLDGVLPNGIADNNSVPPYYTFRVAYGRGNYRTGAPIYINNIGSSTGVVIEDFNNDGLGDLAIAEGYQNSVRIAYQNPDGTFTPPAAPIYAGGGSQNNTSVLVAADFNGDGKMDLATNLNWARTVYVLLNNGNGQFSIAGYSLSQTVAITPSDIAVGDFNNDNKIDIVGGNGSYAVLLNDGTGVFTAQPRVSTGTSDPNRFAVGDFNADGKADMALTRGSNSIIVYRGNGDGTLTPYATITPPLYATRLRASDLNGDGRSDLVLASGGVFTIGGARLSIMIADPAGNFSVTTTTVPGGPNDILFADLNGDSFKDFLLINSPYTFVTVYAGNGTGTFTPQSPLAIANPAIAAALGDLNQDQKLDLATGTSALPTAIFFNETPAAPCLSIGDVAVGESAAEASAQFSVQLSAAAAQTVTVDYRVVGRSARAGSDYTAVNGTLTFVPGITSQPIGVPVAGDSLDEIDETFQVVLSNPVNASLPDPIGVGTINDDDAAPGLSIADVTINEGTGGAPTMLSFTASLTSPTGRKAKATLALANGTATSGADYLTIPGAVVFGDGDFSKQITVPLVADAFVETDETFFLRLSDPLNLQITDNEAVGTILNDDFGGTLDFQLAVSQTPETDDAAVVTVTRTGGAAAGIIVTYATSDGTAHANADYLPSGANLVFDAGETSKTFLVPILDDAIDEADSESINLTLSNALGGAVIGPQSTAVLNIADNDSPPVAALSGISQSEGNAGTQTAVFSVRLQTVSGRTITVGYSTSDGTATAPADYQPVSGTLTFLPGVTIKTVPVEIVGDLAPEPDEIFYLNLASPSNVVLLNTQATGTIVNDDTRAGAVRADFDGDGKTDISIYRPSVGDWWYLRSSDGQVPAFPFGAPTDKVAAADYTGDGRTDVAIWRPGNGEWYILRSEDSTYFSFPFGSTGDIPVPGDYDGDAIADAAVFRPSTSTWFVRNSTGGVTITQFGASTDLPVIEDFDGDGKSDIAIFRPSNGQWWILQSQTQTTIVHTFGNSADRAVPGDFTGDGKADVAIFRPATGEWFIQRSEDFSYYSFPFGSSGDLPSPGDYDGDGRFDAALFRPATTTWYVERSTAGTLITSFGAPGDIPVPGAFVP